MRESTIHFGSFKWLVLLLSVAGLFGSPGVSQVSVATNHTGQAKGPPASSGRSFVIRHVRIFDGKRIITANSVFVQDGKIKSVGKDLPAPEGIIEIHAAGDTLIPGLIDSHTHDWGDSTKQALLFGVTTELNMAGIPENMAKFKHADSVENGSNSADLRSAGNVVTPPKGHGTEYGVPVPTLASADKAQQFVDDRIAEGSDYIKIILEDGHVCHITFSKLSSEELAAAIMAAHKRAKMAIVHISSQDDARQAIASGADGIAHLFADSSPLPDFAEFVHRHHAFVITTLTVIQSGLGTPSGLTLLSDNRLSTFLSTTVQSSLKAPVPFTCSGNLENAFAAAKKLQDAGVPLLAGTDAPAPGSANGVSLHGELRLLVRAGLSPSEALAAATSVPATVFHLSDRGRIAPGFRADLLLVRGDPTVDIDSTADIVAIWKAGVKVDRERITK